MSTNSARGIKVCLSVAVLLALACNKPALPDGSVQNHVLTWAYDGANGGMTDGTTPSSTNAASQRHVQTWLSYAEAGNAQSGKPQKAYYDCVTPNSRCQFVIYYDPVGVFSDCWPDSAFLSENTSEDYYLHDSGPASSANRTTRERHGCRGPATQYFLNLSNPAVGQWFAKNALWTIPENSHTMMFQDASDADCRKRFHPHVDYTPLELQAGQSCAASFRAALRTVANQMRWKDGTKVPVIVNALAPINQSETAHQASIGLLAPGSNIVGGMVEGAEVHNTTYVPRATFGDVNTASLVYAVNPDAMYVYMGNPRAATGSDDTCQDGPNNYEVGCGQLQLRRNMLATFWLAYDEGHTVLWENTVSHQGKNEAERILTVYPEASIYPTNPVQALKPFNGERATTDGSGCGPQPGSGGIQSFVVACGTLNDGATPAGIYVREFRDCYNFGGRIGAGQCAVVKNTTNRSVTVGDWFRQGYTRLMVLGTGPTDGADVLTAGCGDSRCPASALNPLGAPFAIGKTQVPAFDALFLFHD